MCVLCGLMGWQQQKRWIWAGLVTRKTEVERMGCVCVYMQAYKRGRWEVGGGVAIVLLER